MTNDNFEIPEIELRVRFLGQVMHQVIAARADDMAERAKKAVIAAVEKFDFEAAVEAETNAVLRAAVRESVETIRTHINSSIRDSLHA